MAGASGLDERTIRRIESGKVASLETIQALANAFDIECSELTELLSQNPKPQAKAEIIIPRDGHELLNALSHQHAYVVDAEHTDDNYTAELIRTILDAVQYREIWDDMAPSERYEEGRHYTKLLRQLYANNWYVAVVLQTATLVLPDFGELNPAQSRIPNWITAIIKVRKIAPEAKTQSGV